METKKKSFAIAALRRASYRWPGRYLAMKAANIARNQYVCAHCKDVFGRKDVCLDHTHPVVPVEGFKNKEAFDFNEYIDRMFCAQEDFGVLCKTCHTKKTQEENAIRKANKPVKEKPAKKKK